MTVVIKSIKEIDSTSIASQKEARKFVKITERTVRVKFDSIVIRKGFNLRNDFGDLEELAASIDTTGLQESLTVDLLKDGTAILTDGERRYRAIAMLREKSDLYKEKFEFIDVKTNDKDYEEADRIIAMMAHNTGKPFEPLEEAEGFRRLMEDHKLSLTEIAQRVGRAVPYVEQRLLLASATDVEKKAVAEKKISATAQVHLMRKEKDPVKRTAIVKESVEKGKKVKVRDVKSVPLVKKVDEVLAMVKQADKKNKDGEIQNLLFEIDGKLREIKRDLK